MKSFSFWPVLLAGALAGCAHDQPVVEYREPLTSPGGKYTRLPPAVQNTVRAEAGSAEIEDIEKSTGPGPVVYEVRFKNDQLFPPLYIAPDGSVLTSNLAVVVGASEDTITAATGGATSGLKLGDLPPNVVKTIREKAPTTEVARITKVMQGDKAFYEISFKDPIKNPKLLVDDGGKIVAAIPER